MREKVDNNLNTKLLIGITINHHADNICINIILQQLEK